MRRTTPTSGPLASTSNQACSGSRHGCWTTLPCATVKRRAGRRRRRVQNGQWNLRDVRFLRPESIKNYAMAVLCDERDMPLDAVRKFMGDLQRTLRNKGIQMPDAPQGLVRGPPHQAASILKQLCTPRKPTMVFVILPSDKDRAYGEIKRVAETLIGVPTQCMNAMILRDFKKSGPAYQTNLAMKINAKLGGTNCSVHNGLRGISEAPTMVMGADVTHPAPGVDDRPSVVGMVTSYDPAAVRYFTQVVAQGHRVEVIETMREMTKQALLRFKQQAGCLPQRIVVYRDGVGEGQFDKMQSYEVAELKKACSELEARYNPKVTYMIVQKRNNTRFFPTNQRDADRSGNLSAGTVVDTGIVSPSDFDFYMISHAGLKGTSRPAHYYVLQDENGFSADDLQEQAFYLAHVHPRCTRSVSMPAPAYLAHLASYRGRLYIGEDENSSDTASLASYTGFPTLHNDLKNNLFYA
eukprot:Colp12_sorted_trinity150504_noHs@6128